jgi:DNA-binding transcriptional regulator YiaG
MPLPAGYLTESSNDNKIDPTIDACQMVKKMLKNPAVKAEVDKLNREEFAILDEILAARKQAGLSQAQIAKRIGTQARITG